MKLMDNCRVRLPQESFYILVAVLLASDIQGRRGEFVYQRYGAAVCERRGGLII